MRIYRAHSAAVGEFLKFGREHRAIVALARYFAEKEIFLADFYFFGGIFIVEKGYVNQAFAVADLGFIESHAFSNHVFTAA